ncbi:MAG: twin-arginine translocation signal domain-containing protein [Gemmatimonadota bacterium]|nr:twin-arginine translocation signal domain-containing protein [Gemmatimonadota bacterium]
MNDFLNRRDFLKVTSLSAATTGIGAWSVSSSVKAHASPGKPVPGMGMRIGAPLKVKPALVYSIHQRKEARSWRPWGGLHSREDVDTEAGKIAQELKDLSSEADFPLEVLPVEKVSSESQAAAVAKSDCDIILIFAAGGRQGWLETLAASGKQSIMFLRHKSGPVYLWYEIAHPTFMRKRTDEYMEPGMDIRDIVVDDYGEVLWRLRALYGLKNTLGTRIVAVGGPGSWGSMWNWDLPPAAKGIWKLDIKDITYEELEPIVKKAVEDKEALREAGRRVDEYLAQKGVSLHTDKKFLVNAFVLTEVFRNLMAEADAPAFTIRGCMRTIMPIARTTACMPLSLLNDEGLMAFCESDFVVIPSGILLRYISGKPSFLQDPTHPHDGVVTCAHCTAPRRMDGKDLEPAEIHTHFESDYGAAPKVNMAKGQVITVIAPSFSSEKWIGFRGRIIDHPFYDICRSQVDIEIEGDWRELLEDMQGFHWMLCYGDYLREVEYALKKVGIKWQNITTGRSS